VNRCQVNGRIAHQSTNLYQVDAQGGEQAGAVSRLFQVCLIINRKQARGWSLTKG